MKALLCCLLILASGCASLKTPTPPPQQNLTSVEVIKSFPSQLPSGSSRFEQSQLFFVHADQVSEFAVGLLIPIPLVTDVAVDYGKHEIAAQYEEQLKKLSIYEIAASELADYRGLIKQSDGYQLYPLLFIEECYDEQYRLSLTYQLELGEWYGRYYYHLPTTIAKAQISAPPIEVLQQLGDELHAGAKALFEIIDRDIRGELTPSDQLATVGSLYIVGSKVSGITSPKLIQYKNTEILEQTPSTYLLRIKGNPKAQAKNGGMAFGLHHFQKDQLHTFKLE